MWFFGVPASHEFKLGAPVRSWKSALNNSAITVRCSDVFGQDPPRAFGAATGYPGFL
jgi:hypothetical protein